MRKELGALLLAGALLFGSDRAVAQTGTGSSPPETPDPPSGELYKFSPFPLLEDSIRKDPELFLHENFIKMGGTVHTWSDSQILFFGEQHIEKVNDFNIASFIQAVVPEGSIILVEGVPDNERIINLMDVPGLNLMGGSGILDTQKYEIRGWENYDVMMKSTRLYQQWNTKFKESQIIPDRKLAESLNLNAFTIYQQWKPIAIQERNEGLMNSVRRAYEQHPPMIVVIAGIDHYIQDVRIPAFFEEYAFEAFAPTFFSFDYDKSTSFQHLSVNP